MTFWRFFYLCLAVAFFIVMVCVAGHSQTAKVIELTPAETAEAKRLEAMSAELEKAREALRVSIVDRHLRISATEKGAGFSCGSIVFGWGCGEFIFSDDFRFIVPSPKNSLPDGGYCRSGWCSSNPIISPAFGFGSSYGSSN